MEDGETVKVENHVSSAAAFVEGGIQDPCDDACSICLEEFCESDPSTVTGCKHEFHLQCILEWCQRSSQCPMCWQSINLKDPISQELFEAVEKERKLRSKRPRGTAIFHHPTLGDFELQHLPIGVNDAELEDRIFQHLAAAAAMGRARLARRDGRHGRSSNHSRPQYLVFSTDTNSIPAGPIAASSDQRWEGDDFTHLNEGVSSRITPHDVGGVASSQVSQETTPRPLQPRTLFFGPNGSASNLGPSHPQSSSSQSSAGDQDIAGTSDISLSESLKSRLSAVSMKYKESIAKSTRGWRERLFSRTDSVADISSGIRREVNAGMTTVSRMIKHLDLREPGGAQNASQPDSTESHQVSEPKNGRTVENQDESVNNDLNASTSCNAPSVLNLN